MRSPRRAHAPATRRTSGGDARFVRRVPRAARDGGDRERRRARRGAERRGGRRARAARGAHLDRALGGSGEPRGARARVARRRAAAHQRRPDRRRAALRAAERIVGLSRGTPADRLSRRAGDRRGGGAQRDQDGAVKFILASASPRRRELLVSIGLNFDVIPSHVPEIHQEGEATEEYVARLSRDKAHALAVQYPERWVIAADTTVLFGEQLLEKPADPKDAERMLATI